MENKCFLCHKNGRKFHGYTICDDCKSKMGLFTDGTIARYVKEYDQKNKSFEKEMKRRLDHVEKDYAKKKMKLLYILDRLKHIV